MRRHIQTILLVSTALLVACGGPRDKGSKGKDPVVINNQSNNTNSTSNNMTCGVSCDDRNACTIDTTSTDAECATSCTYEFETMCVADDGCCPTGCTADNDADCALPNTDPVCNDECQPAADACYAVVTSRDATGCVVACDYAPITSCAGGDGCCPTGCSNSTDSDCPVETTNNVNNTNNPQNNCTPKTCDQLDAVCGSIPNGCNGFASCGTCPSGQECTPEGQCVTQGQTCDPNQAGACPTNTPYCVMDTCRECIGAADCASTDICIDGFCSPSPDCNVNPSACPSGYECVNGACELPTGQGCDSQDPASCPAGTFCDPSTSTCVAAGGENGCGFCNADCTCPGSLVCNGMMCEGCSSTGGADTMCPDGQLCLDLLGQPICLPFGM